MPYEEPAARVGGDWAASYLFKYSPAAGAFAFIKVDYNAVFQKLSSREMVEKDHWYHIVDGIPVECTDPNHHEVEIPE